MKSYTQLKEELDQILRQLQDPDIDLEHAIKLHAKGVAVLAELEACIAKTDAAVAKVTKKEK